MSLRFLRFLLVVVFVWLATASQVLAQSPGATRDYWTGAALPLDGSGVPNFSLLVDNSNFLGTPTGTQSLVRFEVPQNNVGAFVARMYSSFIAPNTGNYLFWLAANNQAALYLSVSPSFVGLAPIAKSTRLPSPNYGQWSKAAEQKSAPKALVAGQRYYLLLIHVEDGNNINHAEVRWLTPPNANCPSGCDEGPIPGFRTTTFTLTPPPPSFDFSLSDGGARSLAQGSSVSNPITMTLTSGTTQEVSWTVSGLTSGISHDLAVSCTPTCLSSLVLTASATATLGTATVTVTGTAGALVRTTSFPLTVTESTPTPGFTRIVWNPNPVDEEVSGYFVFVGTTSGAETTSFDVGNVTEAPLSSFGLVAGTTYYFVVKAQNAFGTSDPSDEVVYTPPP